MGVIWFTFVAMWVAVWLGTMTTGSGPHAGDLDARRTGWDIVVIAHVHAFTVYAAIAGTVVLALAGPQPRGRCCCSWSRCCRRRSASPSTTSVCRSAWSPRTCSAPP